MSRLGYMIRKEFTQIRRDPNMLRLILLAPIFQLIVFGYATNRDVRDVPVAIYDGDRSADSRQIITEIAHSHYFRIVPTPDDPRAVERMLYRGEAQVGVEIPRNFSRDIMRLKTAQVGLFVDATDPNAAGLAVAYLGGILRQRGTAFQLREARRQGLFGDQHPGLTAQPRVWYNEDLASDNYMVPGVLGLILLVLTVNMGALSIVRERENGTLEQLMVTPLRSRELLLGKMIPLVVIAMFDGLLIFALALGWFHVPFRGSFALVFGMAAVFLLNTLGLGLLISAISRTQQQAQLTSFMLVMPSVLLSGFMFPIENMPQVVQLATYAIPLRYFLQIVRGAFLRGVGVEILWPQMVALTALGILTFGAGVLAFKRRL